MEIGAALADRGAATWPTLATVLTRLPGADTVLIFGVDDVRQCLQPIGVAGRLVPGVDRLSIAVGERMSGWVAATRQPMLNVEAALDLFDAAAPHLHAAAAVACDSPSGLVVVAVYSSMAAPFTRDHAQLIEAAVAFFSDAGSASPDHPLPRPDRLSEVSSMPAPA